MVLARIIGAVVLFQTFCVPAYSCDVAVRPTGNSFRWFYDADAYGQLGVLGLRNNLHILNEYRCYDLSFLWSKNLRFFFNNRGSATAPRYIGAIVVRLFTGSTYSEGPYSGYLYRNSTDASRTTSEWVHLRTSGALMRKGSTVGKNELDILGGSYAPDEAIHAASWKDLNKQIKLSTSQFASRLREWHAIVASPTNEGFLVEDDSSLSDSAWQIEPKIKGRIENPHYFIARTYLVKYQDSLNPRSEYFFQSGAEQADCVYVKLIASGDFVTQLSIRHDPNGPDFITLKMHQRAVCE